MAIKNWLWRKLGANTCKYWTTIEVSEVTLRKWILRSQKCMYTFKQSNRNAVLHLIGHGKRISLETNLASENEPAIFSKGGQFRLSTRKTLPLASLEWKPKWMRVIPRMETWDSVNSGMARKFQIENCGIVNSRVSYSRLPWAEQTT